MQIYTQRCNCDGGDFCGNLKLNLQFFYHHGCVLKPDLNIWMDNEGNQISILEQQKRPIKNHTRINFATSQTSFQHTHVTLVYQKSFQLGEFEDNLVDCDL